MAHTCGFKRRSILFFLTFLLLVSVVVLNRAISLPQAGQAGSLLWVGGKKAFSALSRENGQPGLAFPVDHLEDIAADNNREAVWTATAEEIVRYGFDGTRLFRYALKKNAYRRPGSHERGSRERRTRSGDGRNKDDDDRSESDDFNPVRLSLDPPDGSLWIGKGVDIIKLSAGDQELLGATAPEPVVDLSVDISESACWVALRHSVVKYDSNGVLLLAQNLEKDASIRAIAADASTHSLWVGTGRGVVKIDARGRELFRLAGPAGIQDLKTNSVNDDLWVVTKKRVYKYSKEGGPLFRISLCPDEEDDRDDETRKPDYSKKKIKDGDEGACAREKDEEDGHDEEACGGNLITLAVDPDDGSCWVAWRKDLLKLSAAGETLIRTGGFKQIEALDIGLPKLSIKITEPQEGTALDVPAVSEPAAKPLSITVTSPIDGSVVNYPNISVSGLVNDSTALVQTGGMDASLDFRSFTGPYLTLSPGENIITVSARRTNGETAETAVHVTYDPAYPSPPYPLLGELPAATARGFIEITGLTLPSYGVELFVNGSAWARVNADANGFFRAAGPLPVEGPNHIAARAVDAYGNASDLSAEAVVVRDTIKPKFTMGSTSSTRWILRSLASLSRVKQKRRPPSTSRSIRTRITVTMPRPTTKAGSSS